MSTIRTWPDHLLTLDEWDALPEDTSRRIELVEGVLLAAPRPTLLHQRVVLRLAAALDAALPPPWTALPEVELTVEVLAVVEVLSPGTRRTNRVTELAEYADVGIGSYLLVDLGPPVTMTELRLVDGGFEHVAVHRGRATITLGVGIDVDLDALVPPR